MTLKKKRKKKRKRTVAVKRDRCLMLICNYITIDLMFEFLMLNFKSSSLQMEIMDV